MLKQGTQCLDQKKRLDGKILNVLGEERVMELCEDKATLHCTLSRISGVEENVAEVV